MNTARLSDIPDHRVPLTLMFHDGTMKIENDLPDVMDIAPSLTLALAGKMDAGEGKGEGWENFRRNESFMRLFRYVFPEEHIVPNRGASTGVRHIAGMIVALALARASGLRAALRFPESYLHPKAQLGLADMLIDLSQQSKSKLSKSL